MTKLTLALVAAVFAGLASTGATAADITLKAPRRADRIVQGACWWEPPVYYRYRPEFVYYPYDDVHRRPGCRNTYYAPRWSGVRLNPWTN